MTFKNFEEYKSLRDSLIEEAEVLLASADKKAYKAKIKEVEEIDEKFEDFRTEQANIAALKDKAVALPESINSFKGEEKMENVKELFDVIGSDEYRNAYLKNLQGKELTSLENAAVSGGQNLIPTQTMNKIIGVLEENPILRRIDMTFIPSNITYPAESAVADASWVAMATAATDSADTYTAVSLGAYKLIKTVEIGADVQAMAIDAFENWLVIRLANKIDKACDKAVFNGTGSNQPTGILKSGAVASANVGTYTKTGPTYADLCAIIGALPSAYHNAAVFALNRKTFFTNILGIATDEGQKVVVADAQSPARFNILGYPVICDDNVPEGTIILGDFSAYKFNFAKSPEVTADGSVGFRTGSTVYRAMALADGKVGDPNAFVVYTAATS